MPRRSRSTAREVKLAEYRRRRDFGRTGEPHGNAGGLKSPRTEAGRYVIQQHHASREHFDLRLELDGVMKSWAVPKGPSRDPSARRLAVHVEDHPFEYNTFEGIIPQGEYGAGAVMIWDRGRYVPEGGMEAMRRGLGEGKLSFTLEGERLAGGWTLIRMHGRGRDGRQWLLLKQKDAAAVPDDDLAQQDVASVASGRVMSEIASGGRPPARRGGTARGTKPGKVATTAKTSRSDGNMRREKVRMQDEHGTGLGNAARREGNGQSAKGRRLRAGRSRKRVNGMKDLDGVFEALLEIEEAGGDGTIEFGRGSELAVSSLDKFYFRDAQRTKGDLMRYYVRAAPWLLPLMADRPLALKRHPDGVEGQSFFQHAPPENTPPGVRVERVPSEDGLARRLTGGDLITLLYCVQLGSIAVNPWHSRVSSLETPDYSVIDLDPGPRTPFLTVVHVARWLHEALEDAGISAAVKTSGSRGLHIVIPLPRRTSDESAQLMAQVFARRVADAHRKEATIIRSKSQRSERAVYVDYLQNVVGKTVAAALSVRARPGATVSTPLAWAELTDDLDPTVFTIDTVPDELEARGRMFLDVLRQGNRLERLLASG